MTETANPSLDTIEQIASRAGVDPIAFLCIDAADGAARTSGGKR
jgi:hypothetical protein